MKRMEWMFNVTHASLFKPQKQAINGITIKALLLTKYP